MKLHCIWMSISLIALVSGNAFAQSGVSVGTVGPSPRNPPVASTNGSLVVFSALDPNAHFNSLPYHLFYSDYKILSAEGKLLRNVHNDSGKALEGPVSVTLPAGSYQVVAPANGYGTVTVTVLVEANRTTTLHLDGGGSWPNRASMLESNPIRLPDGRIIGWRAGPKDAAQPGNQGSPSSPK